MSMRMSGVHRTLGAAAIVLAVLAAFAGAPARRAPVVIGDGERADAFVARTVGAVQLAAWIREGARDLRVLDLRGESKYEARHVPSAEGADFARLDTLARRADGTVVLYSDDDVHDAQAWANLVARGHRNAYVLNGGMDAWMKEVIEPVLRGDSADYVAALSRYFGGTPRTANGRDAVHTPRVEPADAAGELGETRMRGC
jgi:rhodanese-related sulfurtransferase